MDHEANFTGIGSPINIDINSVCETRSRSCSSSAASTSSSACTSGEDEKSSEDKDEEEEEKKVKGCVTDKKFANALIFDEMNNEKDISSVARNEKNWREHQIIDEENLKVSTNKRNELTAGVNLSFQHPSDDVNQSTVISGDNGFFGHNSPPEFSNDESDEPDKTNHENGTKSDNEKVKHHDHAKVGIHETTQTVQQLKDLLITGSATKSEPPADKVTNNEQLNKKGSKKKKEQTELMTSSSGGVVRNVGPRLAAAAAATKEVPAKKDGGRKERKKEMKNKRSVGTGPNRFEDMHCAYCNVTFYNRIDFQNHCRSDRHQHTIMSDEGRTWKFRPPPRGVGSDSYSICQHMSIDD